LVVDDRGQIESDIVLGHANLAGYFDDLDLNVDGRKMFTQGVNFDQTRIERTLESTTGVSIPFVALQARLPYRPNLVTRPTSPCATGLNGLGQQMQHGIAPKPPMHSPNVWTIFQPE
jgi:hypothetical protein